MEKTFNYYYGSQAEQFSFIRIPRILILNKTYEPISLEAKMLYGLLIDHLSIAYKNQWIDEKNRIYLIYPIKEIQTDMNISKKKAMQYLSELESFGLIEKRIRGQGLPNLIYVKRFI